MNIYSAAQIKEWDLYTIQSQNISAFKLMEQAATSCTSWISKAFGDRPYKIFCGKGNNGGDGLAIARLLLHEGKEVDVYILEFGAPGTADFQANLHRLHQTTNRIHFIQSVEFFPTLLQTDIIIDALYGSGLNRPLAGLSEALVEHINLSNATIISIDLPSGMFVDASSKGGVIIKASHTLTFQSMKLCFLPPENDQFVGQLEILDIGLSPSFVSKHENNITFLDQSLIAGIYKPRNKFAHKGTFGHALMVAGSKGKIGAAVLSCKACLRSGVGLLTACVPEQSLPIIQTAVSEAMALPMVELDDTTLEKYAGIGIGPGLGTDAEASTLLFKILRNYRKPVVLDADALNILSQHKDRFGQIPKGSILTPHPKEFARLFGDSENDFERMKTALEHATKLDCYIILKGHYTFIACPDGKGFFNSTGNAGMATGGSGDVLTGIITGLLAQGYTSLHAALLGVYLHGLAGDIVAKRLSQEALIAGDIIKAMGKVFIAIAKFKAT